MSDPNSDYDSLADLRDASRERLLTEIGMLRQQQGISHVAQMKREVLASRDAVYGMSAELGELRAQLKRDVKNAHNSARMNMMQTPTWKIGKFVMIPVRMIKRLLRKK
jgi:hypothetical protein